MRQQIFEYLYEQMADHHQLFLLTADMGINLVEKFQEAYPSRYANVGIAEQNLIGIGAGLCNAGFRPWMYTISNFLIHRCFEQIRNDLVLHSYPAVLLGTSTGYDNAPLGPTHHVIDDWGCLVGLREIDIFCPASAVYAQSLVPRLMEATRPSYVRIPKGDFATPATVDDFYYVAGRGRRSLLVTYGSLAQQVLAVQEQRPEVSVLVANRLHPLDQSAVADILATHEQIITVEDHFPDTGMYGTLCKLCGSRGMARSIIGLGPPGYDLRVGKSAAYYHDKFQTDAKGILQAVLDGESMLSDVSSVSLSQAGE